MIVVFVIYKMINLFSVHDFFVIFFNLKKKIFSRKFKEDEVEGILVI